LFLRSSFLVNRGQDETIQLTSCKRFDNNCYHLQCIAIEKMKQIMKRFSSNSGSLL